MQTDNQLQTDANRLLEEVNHLREQSLKNVEDSVKMQV